MQMLCAENVLKGRRQTTITVVKMLFAANDTQHRHCKHLHLDASHFGLSFMEIFYYVCFKQMELLINRRLLLSK